MAGDFVHTTWITKCRRYRIMRSHTELGRKYGKGLPDKFYSYVSALQGAWTLLNTNRTRQAAHLVCIRHAAAQDRKGANT